MNPRKPPTHLYRLAVIVGQGKSPSSWKNGLGKTYSDATQARTAYRKHVALGRTVRVWHAEPLWHEVTDAWDETPR